MERSLESEALEIIRDKYLEPGGKGFILHLISAFVCNEPKEFSYMNSMDTKSGTCCILNINVSRCDLDNGGNDIHYGYMSDKSDKILSMEAYKSLRKFVELMMGMKDRDILKMSKYIVKEKKIPKSKNEAPKEKVFKESKAICENRQAII